MPWWSYAREHYLDLNEDGLPDTTTMYYDPQLDLHHRVPSAMALTTSYYAAPQFGADAQRLFDAACRSAGLDGDIGVPLRPGRGFASALILAREWGRTDLEARLVEAIEASYEPTWDNERGEFTWGLGLNEAHPRGQFNAFLAAAEAAGRGRWEQLSAAPLEACPQVVDVDFPALAFTRAEWERGGLYLTLAPLVERPDERTTFRIVGVEPRQWDVAGIDGVTMDATGSGTLVRVPLVAGDLSFTPGSY